MITISDDDLVQNPIIRRGSWMETVNEIHGVYPQRILTEPVSLEKLYSTGVNDYGRTGQGTIVGSLDEFTLVVSGTWLKIACGAFHTIAIYSDGTLWGWGYNFYGQLGLNDSDNRLVPVQIGTDSDWEEVGGGNHSSFAIKTNGTLWGTGLNNEGQLGLGDQVDRDEFTQVGISTDWEKVDSGSGHTIATKTDGSIYGTGGNFDGELGLGDQVDRDEFTLISSDVWSFVSCGSYHTLAIKSDDTLWVCGVANSGQTGLGPAAVIAQRILNLTQVGSDTYSKVSGGEYHSIAIKTNGTLWGTGLNFYGQLGLGDEIDTDEFTQVGISTDWEKVFANDQSSFAIKTNGILYGTGYNFSGQLGLNNGFTDVNVYTQVGTDLWDFLGTLSFDFSIGVRQ